MRKHRLILVGDIVWWGLLSLLVTGLCIGAAFTPQEWDAAKIGLLIGVPIGFWTMSITVWVSRWRTKPDQELWVQVTENGSEGNLVALVWSEVDIPSGLDHALRGFLEYFSDPPKLTNDLATITIELRKKPIRQWGRWAFWENPKNGLQKGKSIVIHMNSVYYHKTALVHEMLHMVHEVVYGKYDPKHEDKGWWGREADINENIGAL